MFLFQKVSLVYSELSKAITACPCHMFLATLSPLSPLNLEINSEANCCTASTVSSLCLEISKSVVTRL